MRFHPRHYLLIGVIVLLGIWNFMRLRHKPTAVTTEGAIPRTTTPGWLAYDRAASLRDAPQDQFTPAMDALHARIETAGAGEAADLRGCQIWLQQYRKSMPTAGGKANDWAMLATSHVKSCTQNHQDIGR